MVRYRQERKQVRMKRITHMDDGFCFVCCRPTEHVAEHDDLVLAGMVRYRNGSVVLTPEYDEDKARAIEMG